jgi:glycerol uptake facilitator-like aquaporin
VRLIDASNGNIDALADVSPIRALLDQGCDLELDILPVVAREVPELPRPLRNWGAPWLDLPSMAGPADYGALGHPRSGRSHRLRSRDRAGLQKRLPYAQSAHRDLHSAAAALARSAQLAKQAARDRPHDRRAGESGRAELMRSLAQRAFTEWLGTVFLLAAVVRSGIMAQRLSGGNVALVLLCNTLPTGAILVVLILIFEPISGAHFNPAVSLAFALRGDLSWSMVGVYVAAQLLGGIVGVWVAHLMFELPLWQFSATVRSGPGQWLAEAVASFGLVLTIFGWRRARSRRAVCGRALYHLGLLVYGFHFIRQSCRDNRTLAVGHLRRHRSNQRYCLYLRTTGRHAGSSRARALAWRPESANG